MQKIRKGYQETILLKVKPFVLPFLFHNGYRKVGQITALLFIIIAVNAFMQVQPQFGDMHLPPTDDNLIMLTNVNLIL